MSNSPPINDNAGDSVPAAVAVESKGTPLQATARRRVLEVIDRRPTDWKRTLTSTGFSVLMHGLALFGLAFVATDPQTREVIVSAIAEIVEPNQEPIIEQSPIPPAELNTSEIVIDANLSETESSFSSDKVEVAAPVEININDFAPQTMVEDANSPGIDLSKLGDKLAGRTTAAKSALVKAMGGNSASEHCVATGLSWIAKHQNDDGSWSFDHTKCKECDGKCSGPGSMGHCTTAATGLALLSYFGAGHTHKSGDYQKQVRNGLDYLLKQMKLTSEGADFRGVTKSHEGMYAHAIATIALCEGLALSKDGRLRQPAIGAIKFITTAQDPKGGGWRYAPRQPGDTSVVGWQIMALKSAQNAKLPVPPAVFKMSGTFLDSVTNEDKSMYAYVPAEPNKPLQFGPSTTSIGLLCRMYLGWDKKNPALAKGVAFLAKAKPQPGNMYYNYYATQVMLHWGGEEWDRWNVQMRDMLIRSQRREGHEAGSWNPVGAHVDVGGRLYQTTLSVMTLEVYYRFLPIYKRENIKVEF